MTRHRQDAGFGFVELLVLIVVVGILASIAMRTMTSTITDARRVRTEREMELLAAAIVGDPARSTDNLRSDFGYFGDIGAFPTTLASLYTNPGYGTWRGPYVALSADQDTVSYRLDEWGDQYIYAVGVSITSSGGGTGFTKKLADAPTDYTQNQFVGLVKDRNDSLPGTIEKDSVQIQLSIPDGVGGTANKICTPDASGQFVFDSIPAGRHPLRLTYLPSNDTLSRYITVLPRHKNSNPSLFKFATAHFGGSGCGESITLRPDGAGASSSLTGCATSNWQCVDEVTPDDNSTLVQRDATSWAHDLYSLPDPAAAACPPSKVTVFLRCRMEQTQGDVRAVLRVNGVNFQGAATPLTTSWVNYGFSWSSNPATGSAWTWSDISALQVGPELKGQNATKPAFCTQVWVVVEY
ncbi:MAG: hypothetical protein NDJ18_01915 [candidate division Zixibacteria bacterium]|nr:hypothetical protein [candidate division Zixibacteria bacterium]